MFTNCGLSLSTATSGGPFTIQPVSSVSYHNCEVEPSEILLKKEFQCNDDCEENAGITAAADTSNSTTTAIKSEVEETVLEDEIHHDTSPSSVLVKDDPDSFFAFTSLLSRMDDLLEKVPKQSRPCYFLTSLLLQCPACGKAYKGGKDGITSLSNHIKVDHSKMRSKLVKVVRQRYTVRKKCDCFACYVNRASKRPKERTQMFKSLSDYSKSVVLENFKNMKGTL